MIASSFRVTNTSAPNPKAIAEPGLTIASISPARSNLSAIAARSGPTGEIVRTALQPREVEELRTTFAEASEALPTRVLTYRLYFEFGSEALTEDSKRTLDAVLGDIASRTAAEILVVGHSDTTPELVRALGGDPGEPIVRFEYDRIYVVFVLPGGAAGTAIFRYGSRYAAAR